MIKHLFGDSLLERRVIPVEAESVCPICSRGILDLDDNSSSYAAGWPDSLHKDRKRSCSLVGKIPGKKLQRHKQ